LKNYPYQYAKTYSEFGKMFIALAYIKDKEENNKKAIECFNEALKVYSFEKYPVLYGYNQELIALSNIELSKIRDPKSILINRLRCATML